MNRLGSPPARRQPDIDHADLVDPVLAGLTEGGTNLSFSKNGYRFTYIPGPRDADGKIGSYTITARPRNHGTDRNFFTDETAVIRATAEDRLATAKDPPI